MKKNASIVTVSLLGLALLGGCQQDAEQAPGAEMQSATPAQPKVVDLVPAPAAAPAAPQAASGIATGKIVETMDAAGYTYVKVDVGGKEMWAAGPTTPLVVGDSITFSTLIPMQNFHSKAMNRDFEVLYFVDGFNTRASASDSSNPHGTAQAPAAVTVEAGSIEKVEGGYTIAEALAQKKELAGKPIKVRGKVTKYTPGIMGKNWIHIVDGSGSEDLTITTSGSAAMGAVIVAEGALSLDRDFGMGYFYEVLMEDATVTAEQ